MLLTYEDENFLLHKTLTLQHLDVKFSCRFIVLKRSYNNHWLIVRANGMHRVCHGGKSTGNWGEKEAKTTKPLPCRHMWWATIRRLPCPRRARGPAPASRLLSSHSLVCLQWSWSAWVEQEASSMLRPQFDVLQQLWRQKPSLLTAQPTLKLKCYTKVYIYEQLWRNSKRSWPDERVPGLSRLTYSMELRL